LGESRLDFLANLFGAFGGGTGGIELKENRIILLAKMDDTLLFNLVAGGVRNAGQGGLNTAIAFGGYDISRDGDGSIVGSGANGQGGKEGSGETLKCACNTALQAR